MRFLLAFLLLTLPAYADILPATNPSMCAQDAKYWQQLVSTHIDRQVQGLKDEGKNAAVTLSYLAIARLSGESRQAEFMGYVYANASHHLGRLVRYDAWPIQSEQGQRDKELIRGEWLLRALRTAPHELSSRLMKHSLALYKTLAWSLLAASTCGNNYILGLSDDPNLQAAFHAQETLSFMQHFVRFEQTHLQRTMYADFLIGSSAKSGMLDQMRFISFNGEEHTSFAKWCQEVSCRTASYDLQNRVAFDQWSIAQELSFRNDFESRLTQSELESVAHIFFTPR